MSEPIHLNLMCANRPLPGYVNLDGQKIEGVDVVHWIDIIHPKLPFPDDSVGEVYWNNGPEHILNTNEMIQELWRVSVDGAKWRFLAPGYLDRNAAVDPTHYSRWTKDTLAFYTEDGFDHRRYEPALLAYTVTGEETGGLEFFVRVIKPGSQA